MCLLGSPNLYPVPDLLMLPVWYLDALEFIIPKVSLFNHRNALLTVEETLIGFLGVPRIILLYEATFRG